jgi:hypothetical protein
VLRADEGQHHGGQLLRKEARLLRSEVGLLRGGSQAGLLCLGEDMLRRYEGLLLGGAKVL